jgi:hypothetical protein
MAQVGEGAHDAVVSPASIVPREADHQLLHLRRDPRAARIPPPRRAIELGGDESPIPVQEGVRLGDLGDVFQRLASHAFGDFRQRAPLRIRQAKPRRQMRTEDAIPSQQVFIPK